SYVVGLLYTMMALWCLSIFGNYSDFDVWTQFRQYHILYWGLLAILLSLGLALYGMKTKDHVSCDLGFIFFILNLYARLLSYLWDNMNRTIFFLLLAGSFWLVGRWSERVWRKGNWCKRKEMLGTSFRILLNKFQDIGDLDATRSKHIMHAPVFLHSQFRSFFNFVLV